MAGKEGKRRRKRLDAQAKKRQAGREAAAASRADIRHEITSGHDAAWGTSPGSMGRVKMESEEALLVSCPECGFSAGRHSMTCPFK